MNQVQTLSQRQNPVQSICLAILKIRRWKIIGSFPLIPKYLVVGAPHTSNWDWVNTILLKGASGVDIHWVGKDSLFRWPLGTLMKRLGGIPVNRRERANFTDQIIELFNSRSQLAIAIAPEGTRGKSTYWRSGFYYMAVGAQVPIQLVAMDYKNRTLEIGPLFSPSGEIDKDFTIIRKFYEGVQGKYPKHQGEIRLRPEDY